MYTILVADDQPSMRMLVRAALDSGELDVIEASDGDQAWQLLQARHPDLVLLDVQMPGRTGLEITRAVRSDPRLGKTRIILLTASVGKTDIDAGMAAGADDYLVKPFPLGKLRAAVKRLLPSDGGIGHGDNPQQ